MVKKSSWRWLCVCRRRLVQYVSEVAAITTREEHVFR